MRLWDLELGMPLGTSRPLGGTVRAVALDAHLAAAGGTDGLLRLWDASGSAAVGAGSSDDDLDSDPALAAVGLLLAPEAEDVVGRGAHARGGGGGSGGLLFDLSRRERHLRGHIGPVSCLSLTQDSLISGSWDFRCGRPSLLATLPHAAQPDWQLLRVWLCCAFACAPASQLQL